MEQYLDALREIHETGTHKEDRTGTGTVSKFGLTMDFDLSTGYFPLVTTKKVHFHSIAHELLWFIKGSTNVKYLQDNGVRIWDEWQKPLTLDQQEFIKVSKKETPKHVGHDGDFSWKGCDFAATSVDQKLMGTWKNMMRRCYDLNHHRYSNYGAKGVFVCKRWHDPKVFAEEVKTLPQWTYKLNDWNNFELDKDYYGVSYYGLDSCVWLHSKQNAPRPNSGIVATSPDGVEYYFPSCVHASNGTDISKSTIHRLVNNQAPSDKYEWEVRKLRENEEFCIRPKLIENGELGPVYGKQWRSWTTPNGDTIDQLGRVVKSIRENPNSRRHIVTAWNPADVDNMALPPCHCFFQFNCVDDKLDLLMYQRSADMFLGVPFNIASYALLLKMVAQVTGRTPGMYTHVLGDAHIYTDHKKQVELQLTRQPIELPSVELNKDIKEIDDFTFDDIQLKHYYHHPPIKGKVSV